MSRSITVKVYYEDTDAGGVVYYARYLGFLERARTEFFADNGIDVAAHHREGLFFVVAHVDISYRQPARLGDMLTITTEVTGMKRVALTLKSLIMRGDELLVEALVTIVCIDSNGKPRRLPESFVPLGPA